MKALPHPKKLSGEKALISLIDAFSPDHGFLANFPGREAAGNPLLYSLQASLRSEEDAA